jgi:PAS domain S-box-containing protein
VTFFPAVLFAAFFGGFWAGVTTTLLSSLVVILFWHAAVAYPVHNPEDLLNTVFFVVSGVAVALMVKLIDQAQAEKAVAQSEAAIQEERIKAAELLQESEARLTNIIEGTRAGSWDWQVETGAVVVNERWAEMVGYSLAELAPISIETWAGFAHPDDLIQSNRQLDEVFRGERPYYDFEGRMKHRNGQWLWIRGRGKVVEWSKEGKPLRMAGSHIDVSDRKQAEEMLASLGRELQVILDTAPIGLIKTIDRKIVWINPITLKHLQYSREELLNQTSEQFFPSREAYERFGKDAYAGLSQGKTVQAELSLHRKDGSVILVRYAGKAVDARDLSRGIIWIFEDITDRRQMETAFRERAEMFSALFEKSFAVKLLLDPHDGRIIDANSAALAFYGYSREEMKEMLIADINISPPAEIKELLDKVAFQQEILPLYLQHRLASGKICQVEAYPSPIKFGSRTLLYAIIHDVTARKQMEEDLRTSREEALAADRAKSNLLATVAHEFRTPLSLLSSSLDILDQYGTTLSSEEIDRQNAFIRSASRHLATLANTVLNYSEMIRVKDHGSTTLLDIGGFCQTLADEVQAAWAKRHDFEVRIFPECGLLVVNENLLRRVVENLLVNAFQYTSPGKTISLEVSREDDWLKLVVRDQGIGIEKTDLARVFDSFTRGSNVGQRRGMGLGLSIVKDALVKLEGTISVDSVVGTGTKVEVRIPWNVGK